MLSRFHFLLIIALGSCSVNALALNKKSPLPPKSDAKPYSIKGYSDDAFGLVFLGSLFGGQDYIFASTFVGVSAVAATATNLGYLPSHARVPGAVAVVNLALYMLIKMSLLSVDSADIAANINPSAKFVDFGLTIASVAWSFANSRVSQQNGSN